MVDLKDFNYLFYLDIYPDLKQKNITTEKKAYHHYTTIGIKQKRFYSHHHAHLYYHHCWQSYLNFYVDLKENNILTPWNAYKHYMNSGIREDRKIFPLEKIIIQYFNWDLFDPAFYLDIHTHLNLKTKQHAKEHFSKIGHKKKYIYSIKDSHLYYHYDWTKYCNDYEDLNHLTTKQGFIHYIQYGIHEKRIIYKLDDNDVKIKDFHWEFYLLMNDDLVQNNITTYEHAIEHFKKNGIKEDRFYSHGQYLIYLNHDWNAYIVDYNLDMTEKKGFIYYMKYGKNKNHKVNTIFNEKNFYMDFYIEFNHLKDIKTFDECKKHYLNSKIKLPYSYQHYLIYHFFDWETTFNEHENELKYYKLKNYKSFFTFYLKNYNKIKIKLTLHIETYKILNFKTIQLLFLDTSLIQTFIKKNIIKHDYNFIKEIADFQQKIINKININIKIIDIPLFFDFKNSISLKHSYQFSFVVSSYNNEKNIKNNLLSIIFQNYKDWNIYYSNDASTDNTDTLFHQIINEYELQDRVHYTLNKENMNQSYCKYHNYHMIKDENIVVILDGDDWLCSSDALNIFHNTYQSTDKLVLYSGYKVYYQNKIDKTVLGCEYPDTIKKNGKYRSHRGWHFTHVKTAYAWLFKKIPVSYFQHKGKWLDRCTDLTEMYGVSELAKDRVGHVPHTLCIYNKNNSMIYDNSYYNDYNSKKRKEVENYIKKLNPLSIVLPNIYVINLKEKIEHKEKIIDQFKKLNIENYNFFEALNGYDNKIIEDKYNEYVFKYDTNKIQKEVLTVQKKHIHSLGALGILYSTLSLYKHINDTTKDDHVLILEDDVYFHKDFEKYYCITNHELKNKDFIYLGYNSTSLDIQKILKFKSIFSLNELKKDILIQDGIYGAYSYICSREFRNYFLKLGIDYFIENNLNLDISFNIINYKYDKAHIKNNLTFYILNNHLFIPEVRKDGINKSRNEDFYKERFMNLDNYFL